MLSRTLELYESSLSLSADPRAADLSPPSRKKPRYRYNSTTRVLVSFRSEAPRPRVLPMFSRRYDDERSPSRARARASDRGLDYVEDAVGGRGLGDFPSRALWRRPRVLPPHCCVAKAPMLHCLSHSTLIPQVPCGRCGRALNPRILFLCAPPTRPQSRPRAFAASLIRRHVASGPV